VTDFTITGRLASFGRGGMIKDISNRLLRDFATCLQQRLAAEPSGALTADEAAASAGAASTEEGKSPAEVSGKSPAEVTPPGTVATPPQSAPPPATSQAAAPPPAAAPVKGISLLLGVLADRIKRLFRRG
jgi:hypothetical protein